MNSNNEEAGKLVKVALKDLYPNPFRDLDHYPLRQDKIDELKKSMEETTYWDNIMARNRESGGYEIVFGHHRLAALRELYPETHKIVIVLRRNMSDEQMLKKMAKENMDTWGADALVLAETIRATVYAYANGQIDFPGAVDGGQSVRKSDIRYAPSFVLGARPESGHAIRPYRVGDVASFLGWTRKDSNRPQEKVHTLINALQFIERGQILESELEGKTPTAVAELLRNTVSHGKGNGGLARQSDNTSTEVAKKQTPDINTFARLLTIKLDAILDEELDRTRVESLDALLLYKDHLDTHVRTDLAKTLSNMAVRAKDYADQLEEDFPTEYQPPLVAIAERLDNGSGPHS